MGDDEHANGVVVPDIQGGSAGDTLDEAVTNAKEAIEGHLEILAETGLLPPEAASLAYWSGDAEFKG